MKEATGESSLTVVAVILIGVIIAVVTPIINKAMKKTAKQAECSEIGQCSNAAGTACEQCQVK